MEKNEKVKILTESALMVAVSSVLCVIPKFKFLPNGGSVTLCSMLPILLLSYRRGVKRGLAAAFVFSLVQILTGFTAAGLTPGAVAVEFLFDYLLAFTVIGTGGCLRGKLGRPAPEFTAGSALALLLRYLCHVISGYLVWGEYAEWFFSGAGSLGQEILSRYAGGDLMLLYSLIYNGTYMLPELILTCTGAFLLSRTSLLDAED